MTNNLGETIRRLRKFHDITQETLADAVGVTIPAVSKWERAETYPDMRTDFHLRLAGINFGMKQHDSGYAELEKAIDLYVKYADLPADTILTYNFPLMDMLTENKQSSPGDDTKDKGEYACWWAYHTLIQSDGLFSNVQEELRFRGQIERLTPYI